jgi:hypothetical protein
MDAGCDLHGKLFLSANCLSVPNCRSVIDLSLWYNHNQYFSAERIDPMTQEALIEEIGVRLNALPPAKLVVVLDFVSYLVERDPDQAWFWTPEWQAGERQADEDLRTGNFDDFDTMDDFIALLKREIAAA